MEVQDEEILVEKVTRDEVEQFTSSTLERWWYTTIPISCYAQGCEELYSEGSWCKITTIDKNGLTKDNIGVDKLSHQIMIVQPHSSIKGEGTVTTITISKAPNSNS